MDSSLLALSRGEQKAAKNTLGWASLAHLLTLAASAAALFAPQATTYALAVAALLFESVAWWLRYRGYARHDLAEAGRRTALLLDSLGPASVPQTELALMRQRFTERARRLAPDYEHERYYASDQQRGPARLRENLLESVFWSANLYRAAATAALVVFGVLTFLIVVGLLIVVVYAPGVSVAVARIVVLALSFLAASDALSRSLSWRSAADQCEALLARLGTVASTGSDQLLALFGDYSAATATRPPIPERVYRRNREQLEREAARLRQSAGTASSAIVG